MYDLVFNAEEHQRINDLPVWTRWRIGLRALIEVGRDPNRTDKVLEGYEHLNAGGEGRRAKMFYASPEGEVLYRGNVTLDATTVDFDALARLPEGTLGHAYAKFMRDHGLTPDIFSSRGALSREVYVIKRLRQTHDLWHVLTGIDTNVPGELELQAFTFTQLWIPSAFILVTFGSLRWMWKWPLLPFFVLRGMVRGLWARPVAPVHWETRWTTPVAELRRALRTQL